LWNATGWLREPYLSYICNVVAQSAHDSNCKDTFIVRKPGIHIALISFLAFSLLFNQVALNFFHDKHNAHGSYRGEGHQAHYNKHGEHCKVCSLDTLFHPYFEAPPEFYFSQSMESFFAIPVVARVAASVDFTRDRSPPFQG
jgi:hypothetical protein